MLSCSSRAVVFVTADTLLQLTGAEYEGMPFQNLHDRLCGALRGGAHH